MSQARRARGRSEGAGRPRIGLFGGSFDPVHVGHLHAARVAREHFDLDRIVLCPAARPPHKPDRRLASGSDRARMLELAVAGEPGFVVCDLELSREGPSYTYDTVVALPRWLGVPEDAPIFLILGTDNLRGLERWHRVEELLERVQPVVVYRSGDPRDLPGELAASLPPRLLRKVKGGLLLLPPVPCSSTELRESFGSGGGAAEHEVPAAVAAYIRERGLYGAST